MSRKLDYIPPISSYDDIRQQMRWDLEYRLDDRKNRTSLGRPLYYRINTQIIVTQECPYNCPFCIERKNPMRGENDFQKQLSALKAVLREHPSARLSVTGGEPGLYPEHVANIAKIFRNEGENVFMSINTAGFNPAVNGLGHINLSVNQYVKPDPRSFPGCTVQTVLPDKDMRLKNLKMYMEASQADKFSFRYLSTLEKHDYDVGVFNELQKDPEIKIHTYRVGDFFVYATFDYHGKHARVTLGDMYQQKSNDYGDGYSNIIIHPDGRVGTNWS